MKGMFTSADSKYAATFGVGGLSDLLANDTRIPHALNVKILSDAIAIRARSPVIYVKPAESARLLSALEAVLAGSQR